MNSQHDIHLFEEPKNIGKLKCTYCHAELSETLEDAVGFCPGENCGRAYHVACWIENGNECAASIECGVKNSSLRSPYIPMEETRRKFDEDFLRKLKEIIRNDSDCEIAEFWKKNQTLIINDRLEPSLIDRIKLAENRSSIIIDLRRSLANQDGTRAVKLYLHNASLLGSCNDFTAEVKTQVLKIKETLVKNVQTNISRAILEDCDDKLVQLDDDFDFLINKEPAFLSSDIRQLQLAKRRAAVLTEYKIISHTGDKKCLADFFTSNKTILFSIPEFASSGLINNFYETQAQTLKERFLQAKMNYDPYLIEKTGFDLLDLGEELTSDDQAVYLNAMRHVTILEEVIKALPKDDIFTILSIWKIEKQLLERHLPTNTYANVQEAVQNAILVSEIRLAIENRDLLALGNSYTSLTKFTLLTPAELSLCEEAKVQYSLFNKLSTNYDQQIVDIQDFSFDNLLPDWLSLFSTVKIRQISLAKNLHNSEAELDNLWADGKYSDFMKKFKDIFLSGINLNIKFGEKFFLAQRYMIAEEVDKELQI